jgi:hypothetical protein
MKKTLLLLLFVTGFAKAQTFIQNSISYPTCFGMCNGTVVLSTTTTSGPFTAVISNTAGCPNSTVQSSTGNTITIANLCPCAGDYSVNIYNSSMVLVGFELLQIPITSTTALVMQTPTVVPAACSSCCNGSVYVSFSGGYAPSNNYSVSLDGANTPSYAPISTVCAGPHTVCVTDQANCVVCTTVLVGPPTRVDNNSSLTEIQFRIAPNPTTNKIHISFEGDGVVTEIKLIDLKGKVVLVKTLGTNSNGEIELDAVPPGVYIAEVVGNFGVTRQKLIRLE